MFFEALMQNNLFTPTDKNQLVKDYLTLIID